MRVKRLLAERREFCTVDTAYEAIDSLNIDENHLMDDNWSMEAPPPFDGLYLKKKNTTLVFIFNNFSR